jgi:UDP-N-acetylglucosamine--N-acetylmuramyl-(pentapeptide) pyrophosphoryl-undecaprenol N-acetylglucosamine transferase
MEKVLSVIISGGGTAGHINPGLTIANAISNEYKNSKITYIGTKRGLENDLVPKAGYDLKHIVVAGFSRKKVLKNLIVAAKFFTGLLQSFFLLLKLKPDLIVGTGGYASGPAILAGKILSKKIVLHEQNALPGLTNRFFSRFADIICTSYDKSSVYLTRAKKIVKTGNPVRESIFKYKREEVRKELGIKDGDIYILVFGGSLGAEKINKSMQELLSMKLDDNVKILFAPGKKHYESFIKTAEKVVKSTNNPSNNIEIVPYIYDMDKRMNAADLLITRGGAITLSEATALGKPLIIIPSPYVAENHQMKNALALKDTGAADIIEEKELDGEKLYLKINEITKDKKHLNEMSVMSYGDGIRDATARIMKAINSIIDA